MSNANRLTWHRPPQQTSTSPSIGYLQGNYLSGYIPSEFGDLVELEAFFAGNLGLRGKQIDSVCKDAHPSTPDGPQRPSPDTWYILVLQ
ncbi:hypothetical protein BS78_08G069400 [Paspalum vaginatum]|nr:hypothetical protein BS78_08G069400 [Paspalum vaginatum]